ncbi:hypothetical protein RND81_13G172400 [Saponaria officinalis]|uniref:Protein XRI1 n=1 Tax=Saponaria officinalis TaxID=3572 RepID=A0AAW1H214_SAPOF
MENNAPCLVLPNSNNYSNLLSTGYLEDALIEFSVRFKRRRLTVSSNDHYRDEGHRDPPLTTPFTDDLSYWNNWLTNYNMHPQEELSQTTFFDDQHMPYSSSEMMEKSMEEMCEDLIYYPESNNNELMLEDIIGVNSPKIEELLSLSSCSKHDDNNNSSLMTKSTSLVYNNNDTYSTDSSSTSWDKEMTRNNNKMNRTTNISNKTKMVYPFGLVKPGGEEGDITLNDINRRILMPPTRPLKHPVGDFACRPAVSPDGPGLSGKAVVALTKIQTQGRGTITIIRTKG